MSLSFLCRLSHVLKFLILQHKRLVLRILNETLICKIHSWNSASSATIKQRTLQPIMTCKMSRLCACLLNISEARSQESVTRVANAAISVNKKPATKAAVLNAFSDMDYNRSVITIAASVENIGGSVARACEEAFRSIDMSTHAGGHPRLGAVDLIPIHPLGQDTNLEECGRVAKSIASELSRSISGSSFFLFGAADLPRRRGLVQRRKDVHWYSSSTANSTPDVGGPITDACGLTGIGAIPYVMNCNVTIDTTDVSLGRNIAADIRATNPTGLPGVQSMAFAHEGKVEIACNVEALILTSDEFNEHPSKDILRRTEAGFYYTPGEVIADRIATLASVHGVHTFGSSLVGFSPEEAHQVAAQAIASGQEAYWLSRKTRMM